MKAFLPTSPLQLQFIELFKGNITPLSEYQVKPDRKITAHQITRQETNLQPEVY
jgi:hypothetical protein